MGKGLLSLPGGKSTYTPLFGTLRKRLWEDFAHIVQTSANHSNFKQICKQQVCGHLSNCKQRVAVTKCHAKYLYVFLLIIAALQQVRQWHREEGKVHGETLGDADRRWESVLGNQRERGHVNCVPSGKSLLLVLGSYRRRGGGAALEEESNDFQDTVKRKSNLREFVRHLCSKTPGTVTSRNLIWLS